MNVDQRSAAVSCQDRRKDTGYPQRSEVVGFERRTYFFEVAGQQASLREDASVINDDRGVGSRLGQCGNRIGIGDVECDALYPWVAAGLGATRCREYPGGATVEQLIDERPSDSALPPGDNDSRALDTYHSILHYIRNKL
jgi:hypothetical protein